MKPDPDRFITRKPQLTLQPERTDAILFANDQPHGKEPKRQWLSRLVENRSGRHRCLVMAFRTLPKSRATGLPASIMTTPWATKTRRPANTFQVSPAIRIRSKPLLKLQQIRRVIRHSSGPSGLQAIRMHNLS
jgi:hypothetical protein